jgi:hypothetical protein
VRSRLNQARTKLVHALDATSDRAHNDAGSLTAAHRALAEETLASAHRGNIRSVLAEQWSPHAEVAWPTGLRSDPERLLAAFDRDLSDGVRQRLRNVVASREVVIWSPLRSAPP